MGPLQGSMEPAGPSMSSLETSGRHRHARDVAAPQYSKVTEHVGETARARACRLRTGKSPMRHFTNEEQSAVPETVQEFKRWGGKCDLDNFDPGGTLATFPGPGFRQRYRLAGQSDAHSWVQEGG
jgi:hypothetical protein